jgi:predicted DsbA family dithiol-disulfide isomerase
MPEPIRLVAYSDYLCPWCYNASRRLHRLADETPDLTIEWRSYLLRPSPGRGRDLERFKAYTQSWQRPAAEPDGAPFRPWASEEGPPSHSIPAQLAAKAAARVGDAAFRRFHDRLLEAYFEQSRDISADAVLEELWTELGLPPEALAQREDPEILRQVLAEHDEAVEMGATGVPSVRLADRDAVITGALPYESYVQWVERERARRSETRAS